MNLRMSEYIHSFIPLHRNPLTPLHSLGPTLQAAFLSFFSLNRTTQEQLNVKQRARRIEHS